MISYFVVTVAAVPLLLDSSFVSVEPFCAVEELNCKEKYEIDYFCVKLFLVMGLKKLKRNAESRSSNEVFNPWSSSQKSLIANSKV